MRTTKAGSLSGMAALKRAAIAMVLSALVTLGWIANAHALSSGCRSLQAGAIDNISVFDNETDSLVDTFEAGEVITLSFTVTSMVPGRFGSSKTSV